MIDFKTIGFKTNDQMLDRYDDDRKAGKTDSFLSWYAGQEKRALSNRLLDHPALPAVDEDDLDDGDPAVLAKLGPKPKNPPLSTALPEPDSDRSSNELVPA